MTLDEKDTVLKLFVAVLDQSFGIRPGDFLCIVARGGDGKVRGEYRFRYHVGPDIEAADDIHRVSIAPKDSSPAELEKLYGIVRAILKAGPFLEVVERDVNGGVDKLKEALLELPAGWQTRIRREEKRT